MARRSQSLKIIIACYLLAWLFLTSFLFYIYSSHLNIKLTLSSYGEYLIAPLRGNHLISEHYQQPLGPILRDRALNSLFIIFPALLISLIITYYYARHKYKSSFPWPTVVISYLPLPWLAMLSIAIALKIGYSTHAGYSLIILLAIINFTGIFFMLTQRIRSSALVHPLITKGYISNFSVNLFENSYFRALIVGKFLKVLPITILLLSGNYMVLELVMGWPGLGRELLQSFLMADLPLSLAISLFTVLLIFLINAFFSVAANIYTRR